MGVTNILNNTLGNGANLQNLGQGNVNLFGANIPAIPVVSMRDYFLAMMETWVASIPTNSQWICLIETFPNALVKDWAAGLIDGVTNVVANVGNALGINLGSVNLLPVQKLEPINGDYDAWANNTAGTLMTSYPFQRVVGCIFAQNFHIPSIDNISVSDISVENNRGYIQNVIMENRSGYANRKLILDFLETNSSLVDNVIRPWMILTSHYGLVARDPDDEEENAKNIKTNIIIMEYTRSYQNLSQIPRKVWQFYDCAPVDVSERENKQEQSDEVNKYRTSWVYSRYNLKNNLYLPIPDLLEKISSGNWNNIFAI